MFYVMNRKPHLHMHDGTVMVDPKFLLAVMIHQMIARKGMYICM